MSEGTHLKTWAAVLILLSAMGWPAFAGRVITVDDDGPVDFLDFTLIAFHWLENYNP